MKLPVRFLVLLAALTATVSASAQERIEAEEAQRIAHKLYETIGNPSDVPFQVDIDPDKPNGFKAHGLGLMALPDRKLAGDFLGKVGKEILPVGQLWTLDASLALNGRPIAKDQVRFVTVGEPGKTRDVQLYYLGVSKSDTGELQLVVFAKDKAEPVLRAPLIKAANISSSAPIELDGRKKDEESGLLTVRLLGEYTAEITIMKQE